MIKPIKTAANNRTVPQCFSSAFLLFSMPALMPGKNINMISKPNTAASSCSQSSIVKSDQSSSR